MRHYAIALTIFATACKGEEAPPAAAPPAEVPAMAATVDQFKSLKWLEGRWRGTRSDSGAFFEEYRFINDSTIATVNFADSTMKPPTDTGTIALRGGTIANGIVGGQLWFVATSLDSVGVHFEPRGKAKNAFTWKREPKGGWIATLGWVGPGGLPQRQVYVMKKLDSR
jgi:hypothetical protein